MEINIHIIFLMACTFTEIPKYQNTNFISRNKNFKFYLLVVDLPSSEDMSNELLPMSLKPLWLGIGEGGLEIIIENEMKLEYLMI